MSEDNDKIIRGVYYDRDSGFGSINQNQHPNFAEANWQDKSKGFRLIYRLGIDPEYQNNGLHNNEE